MRGLVPNGQYIDAQNVRLGSTEGGEIGSVENAKGNVQQSTLQFPAAIPDIAINLSDSAVCIGSYADSANETMYWFVHDPAWLGIFPNGAPTGTAGVSGTNTSANTNELIDNTASFTTDGTSVGDLVVATASGSSAYITSILTDTTLVLK